MSPTPPIDGIESTTEQPHASALIKTALLFVLMAPYVGYILWCVFLLSILPNAEDNYREFVSVGQLSSLIVGGMLVILGLLLLKRVAFAKNVPLMSRMFGTAKIGGLLLPGLILSFLVPMRIGGEPPIGLDQVDPPPGQELVAPLVISFDATRGVEMLQRPGLNPIKYIWDFDGDGVPNEETLEPRVSARYETQGIFNLRLVMELSNGGRRITGRRIVIPRAVFSVSPLKPIIDEPVQFSVAHLSPAANPITEVHWDFQSDGEVDEISNATSAVYTYLRTGTFLVSVQMLYQNQSQIKMEREILIHEPEPLPFDVSVKTEPEYLVSPPPFGVLFEVITDEEHDEVKWDLGEGVEMTGDRIGHTFHHKGDYRVLAEIRSLSGAIARIPTVVRVVDTLRIPDLKFEGSHEVRGKKIYAEVPVTIQLTPITNLPLVNFFWESPKATVVESTETNFKATYRRPGSYPITLIGSDPSGSVFRLPLTLEVSPPSSSVSIRMNPEGGVAPLLVRFDASETVIPGEEITGFEWNFGDAATGTRQGGAQVEYLYDTPGTYTVSLKALTTSGKSYPESRTIVIRAPVLDACFQASRTEGKAPLGVKFRNCSTGNPSEITWDFGDGSESDQENPVHVFERPGKYGVTLKMRDNAGGISQESLIITVE